MSQRNYHRWIHIIVTVMLMGIGLSVYLPAGAQDATEEAATEAPATTEAPTTEPPPTEAPTTEAPPVEEPTQEVTVESPTVEPTAEVIPTEENTPVVEPTDEVTTEPTTEATVEATAEVTAEATSEATAEATVEATEAAATQEVTSGFEAGQQVNIEGWLSAITGDPLPGTGGQIQVYVRFSDDNGNSARLLIDADTAYDLTGKRVRITGVVAGVVAGDDVPNAQTEGTANIAVTSIREVQPPSNASLPVLPAAFSGSYPYLNVLCKFSDLPLLEPYTPVEIQNRMASTYPGLNNFWQSQSYNIIDINGTATVSQWRTMPRPASFYTANDSSRLEIMRSDCLNLFVNDNALGNFYGFNMFFNAGFGCCAWGGPGYFTVDGVTKWYGSTWIPADLFGGPYFSHELLAHEMGHAFWLRHTGLKGGLDYDSNWDTMSGADNCPPNPWDATYGCIGVDMVGFHREFLDWIPNSRVYTAIVNPAPQTVTMERIASPVSGSNPLLVHIPIRGSASKYYTLEARMFAGFDDNLPDAAPGVIIHEVNTTFNDRYAQLIDVNNDGDNDPNDESASWTVGEVFTDITNGIRVSIISSGASSFTVEIINTGSSVAAPPKATLTTPVNNIFTNNPTVDFAWNPVNGANSYDIQIATASNFAAGTLLTLNNATGLTNPAYTLDPAFLTDGSDDGRYYWRVIAENAFDQTAASSSRYFTFDTIAPAVPVADVKTCNVTFTTLIPTFKWGAADGASTYEVQLYVDGNPEETVTNPSTKSRSYKPPVPLLATNYRWTVQAIDAAGNESGFFTPECVSTIQSPNNATPVLFVYADDTPTITWGDITWDNGYEVQIANSRTFRASTTVFLFTSGELPADTTSFVASHLWDGVWYARVRAKRADGKWGGWSPAATFVVDIP